MTEPQHIARAAIRPRAITEIETMRPSTIASVSAHDLKMGGIAVHGDAHISHQNGAYIVAGFDAESKHCLRGFPTIQEARAFIRKMAREPVASLSERYGTE